METLAVELSSNGGAGGGLGFGVGGTGNSGFCLIRQLYPAIDALSPDINTSMAVIQRTGYIDTGSYNETVDIYGVDFGQYAQQYPTTFVAALGKVPINPNLNQIVVGARIVDPQENGTTLFRAGRQCASCIYKRDHFASCE